ncbi:MAG: TPM domain-containing protein [Thiohalobacteraceae bacterium]
MVKPGRMLRHLLPPPWWMLRRSFDTAALQAIEAAVVAAECTHRGEIRVAIEAALDLRLLLRDASVRERAIEVFSELHVWDTAENNGVLIYVLLADHDVEIVADRGIAMLVESAEWQAVCEAMEQQLRAGNYQAGAVTGIQQVSALLARHFPGRDAAGNELPDRPHLL